MIAEKFIYILDKETRDDLLRKGYTMVAAFEKKNIYVFVNSGNIEKDVEGKNYFPSNRLTF